MAEAGWVSSRGKGVGDGDRCGQSEVSDSIAACVSCSVFFFSGATSRLGGEKSHAKEQSKKVRRLSARSTSNAGIGAGERKSPEDSEP